MNNFYKYLLVASLIGFNTLQANSTCERAKDGYTVEIRAGEDICYKYNKETDNTHKMKIQPPDGSGNWKYVKNKIGNKDIWEKIDSK